MGDITYDEIGRIFCKAHRREVCAECGMSFYPTNRQIEEDAGLRKKKTKVEEAAKDYAIAVTALRGMDRMVPRPNPEVYDSNREFLRRAEEKLRNLQKAGEKDVDEAIRSALEEQNASQMELNALTQAWAKQNPGKRNMDLFGPEAQKLYDQVVAPPKAKANRAEKFTCSYCMVSSKEKLLVCSRCKMVAYCSKECQCVAWKAHKKECVPLEKEPKSMALTWEQVEVHGGAPVKGRTLEIRVMLDESRTMRQVLSCKDRVGVVKRVAAYTNNRAIPGLKQGSLLKWKNPRFHYFMDGSSGARIEEEDLVNVTVINPA